MKCVNIGPYFESFHFVCHRMTFILFNKLVFLQGTRALEQDLLIHLQNVESHLNLADNF